jgi:hypothetical protein
MVLENRSSKVSVIMSSLVYKKEQHGFIDRNSMVFKQE